MEQVGHKYRFVLGKDNDECVECGLERLVVNDHQADGSSIKTVYRKWGTTEYLGSEPNCIE
jgi:hypothetical protein